MHGHDFMRITDMKNTNAHDVLEQTIKRSEKRLRQHLDNFCFLITDPQSKIML